MPTISLPSPRAGLRKHCEFFDWHPEAIDKRYMGRFYEKLPEGCERKQMELKHPRGLIGAYVTTLPHLKENSKLFSRKLLDQDFQTFYRTIDEAIEISNIDILQIKEDSMSLNSLMIEEDRAETEQRKSEIISRFSQRVLAIHTQVRPVYITLRKQGYRHMDLVYWTSNSEASH